MTLAVIIFSLILIAVAVFILFCLIGIIRNFREIEECDRIRWHGAIQKAKFMTEYYELWRNRD